MPDVQSQTPDHAHPHHSKRNLPPGLPLILAALLFCVMVFTAIGCKPKQPEGLGLGNGGGPKDAVSIFFSKYQGSQSIVENVLRKLPDDLRTTNPDAALQFAMAELLKGPTAEEKNQGFYTEIPQGTQLLGVKHDQETLVLDFSKQFNTGGGSTSIIQRLEEVKQTAYAVDSRNQIRVDVEGKPLETLGGEGLEVPGTLERGPQ